MRVELSIERRFPRTGHIVDDGGIFVEAVASAVR
jgi:hypothetical protein